MPTSDEDMSWISKLDSVLLEQIARDLEIADGVNPKSWSFRRILLLSSAFTSETKSH